VSVTEAAAFGKVRTEAEGNREVAVRALLAIAPAAERRDSISNSAGEWRLLCWGKKKVLLSAPTEQREKVDLPDQKSPSPLSHGRRG